MKKYILAFMLFIFFFGNVAFSDSVQSPMMVQNASAKKQITYVKNAPEIKYAFIFDGPSEKNNQVLEYFKNAIVKSTAPDFKAVFPENLLFVSDWTEDGINKTVKKAMASNASVIVSMGFVSSECLEKIDSDSTGKFIMKVDDYGLRTFGDKTFNPASQIAKKITNFHSLTHFNKTAILMNENYMKLNKNWNEYIKENIGDIQFSLIPVGTDIQTALDSIPSDCDAVVYTPLYNLSHEQRKALIQGVNDKKLLSFSTFGKEDVEFGALYGSSSIDFDKKLAEATSFNIKDALKGNASKSEKIQFFEEELIYVNKDTADMLGVQPHLRVLNLGGVITSQDVPKYSLTEVFDLLEKQNIDIERKKLLVKAARRASLSAILRYLPTFSTTLGFQQYNNSYAESAKLLYPEKTGVFQMSLDQIIYSPALVTNILVKKKQVAFQQAEEILTEQNMGLELANLYVETLMLENMVNVQKEFVQESKDNLSISRIREKMGYSGSEETMRWAAQLSATEKELIELDAAYRNVRIQINNLLAMDQKNRFTFEELKTDNPAFYTSSLNIIDYVCTPQTMEQFTQMLIEEAYRVSPELAKLKAAIKMKDYELRMYVQKFILPDAKISLEYQDLINPQYTGDVMVPLYTPMTGLIYNSMGHSKSSYGRIGIFAQWTPFEGGSKFAEISRVKAERAELQLYMDGAKADLETHIREAINKAIAAYFVVEKNYKAMYASGENYKLVKDLYLQDKAPISQVLDAQKMYFESKAAALNSRYVFFKELLLVQRGICAVNWAKAPQEARDFIESVKTKIEKNGDISL